MFLVTSLYRDSSYNMHITCWMKFYVQWSATRSDAFGRAADTPVQLACCYIPYIHLPLPPSYKPATTVIFKLLIPKQQKLKLHPQSHLSVGTSLDVRLDSSLPTLFRLLQLASRCLRSSHCARTSSCTLRFSSCTRFLSSSITWLPTTQRNGSV